MSLLKMLKCGVSSGSCEKILDYCNRNGEIEYEYIYGKDCFYDSPESIKEDFKDTKEIFGKMGGRQYYHFVQTFESGEEKMTPDLAHQLGQNFIERNEKFEDFQVYMVTHSDKDHLHNHFVVNSVSHVHGRKFQMNKKELHHWKEISNEISREHQLREIDLNNERLTRDYGRVQTKLEKELLEKNIIPWKDKIHNALIESERMTLEYCAENNINDNQQIFEMFKENLLDFNVEVMRGLNEKDKTITFRLKGENEDSMSDEELKEQKKIQKIRGNKLDPHFKNRRNLVENIQIEVDIKKEQKKELELEELKNEIREKLNVSCNETKSYVEKICLDDQITDKERIGQLLTDRFEEQGLETYIENEKLYLSNNSELNSEQNNLKYEIDYIEIVNNISQKVELRWENNPSKEMIYEYKVKQLSLELEKVYEITKEKIIFDGVDDQSEMIQILKEKLNEFNIRIVEEDEKYIKLLEYSEHFSIDSYGIVKEEWLKKIVPEVNLKREEIEKEIKNEARQSVQKEISSIKKIISDEAKEKEISDVEKLKELISYTIEANEEFKNLKVDVKENKIEIYKNFSGSEELMITINTKSFAEKLSEEVKLVIENNQKIETARLEKIEEDKKVLSAKLDKAYEKTVTACADNKIVDDEKIQEVYEDKIKETGLNIEWKDEKFIAIYRYINENQKKMGYGRSLTIINDIKNDIQNEILKVAEQEHNFLKEQALVEFKQERKQIINAIKEQVLRTQDEIKRILREEIIENFKEFNVIERKNRFDIYKEINGQKIEITKIKFGKTAAEIYEELKPEILKQREQEIKQIDYKLKQAYILTKDVCSSERIVETEEILEKYKESIEEVGLEIKWETDKFISVYDYLNEENKEKGYGRNLVILDEIKNEVKQEIVELDLSLSDFKQERKEIINRIKEQLPETKAEIKEMLRQEIRNGFEDFILKESKNRFVISKEINGKETEITRVMLNKTSGEIYDELKLEQDLQVKTEVVRENKPTKELDRASDKNDYEPNYRSLKIDEAQIKKSFNDFRRRLTNEMGELKEKYQDLTKENEKLAAENRNGREKIKEIDSRRDLLKSKIDYLKKERDSQIRNLKLENFKPAVRKLFNKEIYEQQQRELRDDKAREIKIDYSKQITQKEEELFNKTDARNIIAKSINKNNSYINNNNQEIEKVTSRAHKIQNESSILYIKFKDNYIKEQNELNQKQIFEEKSSNLGERDYKVKLSKKSPERVKELEKRAYSSKDLRVERIQYIEEIMEEVIPKCSSLDELDKMMYEEYSIEMYVNEDDSEVEFKESGEKDYIKDNELDEEFHIENLLRIFRERLEKEKEIELER